MTAAGTCSAFVFNLDKANQFGNALSPLKNTFIVSFFSRGILNLSDTLKSWGESIVNSKDAFIDWLNRYFDVNGLKAGTVELYNKLHDWALIVYEWFATKFLRFIENIPWIVQNWKQIRLSLFKWGTFIGGGGGGALWGMFSSFDNWGKLSELMGNEDFTGAVEKFAELVDQNPDAFKDMGEEAMKEILEKIMEDPKDAKEIAEKLLQEQKEKNKDKKDEEQKEELDKEQIQESFANPKGSPQSKEEVFGYLVGSALQSLVDVKSSAFGSPVKEIEDKTRKAMTEYIQFVKEKVNKKTREGKASKDFIDALGNKENTLINELVKVATEAFDKKRGSFENLKNSFEKIMKDRFTVEIGEGGDQSEAVELDNIIKDPNRKK
ncbi:hypothetical protein A6V39_03820 [Candidatus Mycoplasma haematobovis]|uniref:Uncharacterized protein n=2 Tax=Candidatus Mycoplasma haematobovis TaxID=432608 RepID=A0A1A9QDI7_9MOLU|nr:hypothetical protein A6V39_03820 [Candidatus Mycoplasma haematobovis]